MNACVFSKLMGKIQIMTGSSKWQNAFEAEMAAAETARQAGKEARARVCARRAAGVVLGEYFQRSGIAPTGTSAYDLLKQLQDVPGLPPLVAQIGAHFLLRATPEFTLPIPVDLIAEARWLKRALLEGVEG
jgi:hypothetical protein